MSYRCDICGVKVPPGQPRLVHQVYYPRSKQIKQELGCCDGCHLMLDELPLSSVKDPYYLRLRRFKEVDTVTVDVLEELPERVAIPVDIGRPAKTVTL